MAADIQNAAFTNHDKAREVLEAIRWPDGPICPHCGNSDQFAGPPTLGQVPFDARVAPCSMLSRTLRAGSAGA